MLDELRALAVFARVAEEGSIRGAARALSLSPSVVSHHVKALEERVGVVLLYRSTRKLALTPAGERLAAEARAMVAAAERGLDEARGASAAPSGALRVTMPAFLSETTLCRDVAEFARLHPRVRLTVSFTEVRHDLLKDGFDLALRMGKQEDSTHKTRRLAEMERALVAAPALLQTTRAPRAPKDLEALPFIHLGQRPPVLALKHRTRPESAQITYAPTLTVDSAIALRSLVLAGGGVATLPEVLVRDDLARGRAVELLPSWRAAAVAVYAVWPAGAVKATLTTRFLDYVGPRVSALFGGAARSPRD